MDALGQLLIDFLLGLNNRAAALDGRIAFVMGIASWFLVEFFLRRVMGAVRLMVLTAVIVGSGLTLFQVFSWISGRDDAGVVTDRPAPPPGFQMVDPELRPLPPVCQGVSCVRF